MVTEVGPVADAFEEIRRLGFDPDPKDLLVRGARQFAAEIRQGRTDEARRRELRERLIRRTTSPAGVDTAAAMWAHEQAWARNLPDE